jgi:hypothetical protein
MLMAFGFLSLACVIEAGLPTYIQEDPTRTEKESLRTPCPQERYPVTRLSAAVAIIGLRIRRGSMA